MLWPVTNSIFKRYNKKLQEVSKRDEIRKENIKYSEIFDIENPAIRAIDLKQRGEDLKQWKTTFTSKTEKHVEYKRLGFVFPEVSKVEAASVYQLNDSFLIINSLNEKQLITAEAANLKADLLLNMMKNMTKSSIKDLGTMDMFYGRGGAFGVRHPYHLVDNSPWPLVGSVAGFMLTTGLVLFLHDFLIGLPLFSLAFLVLGITMYAWWRDIVREGSLEGNHTKIVRRGLRMGVILFIVSEIMFFFSFFWAFFHASINPSIAIGGVWPPNGIETIYPWGVPLLNTVILLTSGATVTLAHEYLLSGRRFPTWLALCATVLLAVAFTFLQYDEYVAATFSISDGIYGSVFFMATGFHGFHVFIGTCFLLICLYRTGIRGVTRETHVGVEAAIWYWHFVDVVWLFLFASIYWWGS